MTTTTPTEPEALAAEPDMSWFDIAVTHRREVVILGHSDGWSAYEIEHWWEDAFDTDAPKHLEPGAYRWTDFTIGYWGDSDHINCTGGKFTALSAPAARMLAGEGEAVVKALEAMLSRHSASTQNWTQAVADARHAGDRELSAQIQNTVLAALGGFPVQQARTALAALRALSASEEEQ